MKVAPDLGNEFKTDDPWNLQDRTQSKKIKELKRGNSSIIHVPAEH